MTLLQAILICLITTAMSWAEMWFSFPMLYLPIVVGPLVGFILGDLTTGLICGAVCQIIFLSIVGLGNSSPPEPKMGTIIGTSLAIIMGQGAAVAVVFAILGSYLGQFFFHFGTVLRNPANKKIEKLIEKGDSKALYRMHLSQSIFPILPGTLATFIIIFFGGMMLKDTGNYIPQWIISGLNMFIVLMGALAIATLLKMMWSKKTVVYFFIGFLLAALFHLPIMGVLAAGAVIATLLYLQWKSKPVTASAFVEANSIDDGSDLFDD